METIQEKLSKNVLRRDEVLANKAKAEKENQLDFTGDRLEKIWNYEAELKVIEAQNIILNFASSKDISYHEKLRNEKKAFLNDLNDNLLQTVKIASEIEDSIPKDEDGYFKDEKQGDFEKWTKYLSHIEEFDSKIDIIKGEIRVLDLILAEKRRTQN